MIAVTIAPAWLAEVKGYLQFGEADSRVLASLHPQIADRLPEIIDDFYAAIEAHPRAGSVISGGAAQVERLKRTLRTWLDRVLLGPHDITFATEHARIGRVHTRIGLPQEFMLTAMGRIRVQLKRLCAQVGNSVNVEFEATGIAIDRVLDLELTIMLHAYRENLSASLKTNERLATIGQLAASVGHELRNPLSTIESSLYLLGQRFDALAMTDLHIRRHHEKIARQVKHCGEVITNLLDLARDKPPRCEVNDVRRLFESAREAALVPEKVRVNLGVPEGLTVWGDAADLLHVMTNLFANAAQAQPDGGVIEATAHRDGSGTTLLVKDEGPGVPEEIRDRIFDALFTTRARGTGLGLALCRRVIYAHGGEVSLLSSEKGTSFRVWLPDESETQAPTG